MNKPDRGSLGEVIARYVEAAMPLVHVNLQQGELIAWPAGRWTRQGPGQVQREEGQRISWMPAIEHRASQLHALAEYDHVVECIRSKPEWDRQFDTLVGTPWMRMRLDLAQFIDGCLGAAMTAESEGADPLSAALANVEEVEAFLEASDVPYVTFAPLLGTESFGLGRVEFDRNVSLEPVDEEELERLYTAGLLTPMFPRWPFFTPPSHIVRVSYPVPKVLGEIDPAQPFDSVKLPFAIADQVIDEVVECLRLFRGGLVAAGARASKMPGPFPGYQHHGSPAAHPVLASRRAFVSPDAYHLSPGDELELRTLWERMQSEGFRRSRQLAHCARRFSYKGERTRLDDQLVDLMVAAEALFLADTEEEYRGELRYRLSSRAAWYIAGSSRDRRSIFKLFMEAYAMRSKLVHGKEAKTVTIAGEDFTPARMVEVIEDLLRLALKQAIGEASQGPRSWAVDWDSLLFA